MKEQNKQFRKTWGIGDTIAWVGMAGMFVFFFCQF